MKRKLVFILALTMIVAVIISSAYATEPTQEEQDAYSAAMELFMQRESNMEDPENPPPTPEELKQQAITAFNDFITTYPDSTLCPSAQNSIGENRDSAYFF